MCPSETRTPSTMRLFAASATKRPTEHNAESFQKYLFLYTREFQQEPSFEFVPYRFGSFSFQSYADKRRLVEMGALADAFGSQEPACGDPPIHGRC